MQPFRTIVEPDEFPVKINYDTPALFIGSCFTNSIGEYLAAMKFPALVNPFGIMYNPLSVGRTLERILEGTPFTPDELGNQNGMWFSFMHDTSFSGPEREKVLENINDQLKQGAAFLKKTRLLFLTFGTARVYEWLEDDRVVSNCHKLPARMFRHRLLHPEEIITHYEKLLAGLYAMKPGLQVIFTVSPIRHWKDGAVGNQVSKSVLFVAIHELLSRFPEAGYFPAYEMVMDDLRDYRFYAEDMLHLRDEAVNYIREKFVKALMDPGATPIMKEVEKLQKALRHKPFRPESREYKNFVRSQIGYISQLEKKYPFLDFSEEKKRYAKSL
ncbi:MAG: GSCFA domain-containing protein [Chlorobi bacterium]|nr:GSCFA domain-containing protein [Chlorobiota bacterium]